MQSEPVAQHLWLKKLVGDWSYEHEFKMGPDQPLMKLTGREKVRMLGDLWMIAEASGEMPDGGTMSAVMTLGYDPTKGKFVGSWIGSPMAFMFVYEGELDAAGKVLPLNTTGPSFTDPTKTAPYQDCIGLVSDKVRTLTSQTLGDNGNWTKFMMATYTRIA